MAIEGLKKHHETPVDAPTDDVGAAVEALERLGLVEDRERVTETVQADFAGLDAALLSGEKHIALPQSLKSLAEVIEALDSGHYQPAPYAGDGKYPETSIYNALWTPGADKEGLKAADIGNLGLAGQQVSDFEPHARLAVHSTNNDEPLLHFLGMPFDEMYAKRGQRTQLQALEIQKQDFEAKNSEFSMVPLTAGAVAFIALMRRIKGQTMPIEWGYMRDASLARKTVSGYSFVGSVDSVTGRLGLGSSVGYAHSHGGVGLSVGPKPQTL